MQIHRADVIAALRARGLDDRADWAERQLPESVDTEKNAALLRMLKIDFSGMAAVDTPTA
jgi:lambda repressor-like predicted transcriptional regulator